MANRVNKRDKYLLLSCPEFNDVVDQMMEKDGVACSSTNVSKDSNNYKIFLRVLV
jgi:hypothetical protein